MNGSEKQKVYAQALKERFVKWFAEAFAGQEDNDEAKTFAKIAAGVKGEKNANAVINGLRGVDFVPGNPGRTFASMRMDVSAPKFLARYI